jgi:DNA sulfur modification protein DndB
MISNIEPRVHLGGFARSQGRDTLRRTVVARDLQATLDEGWSIRRRNRRSISLQRPKPKSALLESRVWTLLFRMGFPILSGRGGALLEILPGDPKTPTSQIDVAAVDDEVALAAECKSFETPAKDTSFPERLAKHASIKRSFSQAIAKQFAPRKKRHVGLLYFTWDIILRDNDYKRAEEAGVALFDEQDLQYFEALVHHLGSAARYQFLAEIFRGRQIAGLEIRLPALQHRAGDYTWYTFSIKPSYLLKVAYVAHRAKGKAIDLDAYQRMISKSRLAKIAEYIGAGGMFPTNIVINFENPKHVRFDRGKQEGGDESGVFGWLTFSPAYGSAWIIDGQHRLFAFSGHSKAESSFLSVLAFEGLSASHQAKLFVDINSEQRTVKRSLLVELDATLKWEDEDIEKRVDAIISKAGMALDEQLDSPLKDRVLLADVRRTDTRCVSLTALASALDKPGIFIVRKQRGFTEFGPLWRDNTSECLKRTVHVARGWLGPIAQAAREWWDLGAAAGGGLAMNNGVTVCINVLRSVLDHLSKGGNPLGMDDDDLVERIKPYADALGGYFARMSADERSTFRQLQGVDGQTTGTRMCQEALQREFPSFSPPGLTEWVETRKANYNEQGRRLIEEIETSLQKVVIETLKSEFDLDDEQWWFEGVPKNVRIKVDQRRNESDGRAGGREENFDLVHYRDILLFQWRLFGETFGYGGGGKEKQTKWLVDVANIRNIVMHPSRREFLSLEKLTQLRSYVTWLNEKLQERADAPVA